MRCVIVFSGLLVAGLAAPLAGQAVDCIPDDGCPKDQAPPKCCQPPPCEVYKDFALLQSLERMTRPDVAAIALEITGGDIRKAMQKIVETRPPTPPTFCSGKALRFHDVLRVDWTKPGCPIVAVSNGRTVTRSEALLMDSEDPNKPNCTEFVEAEYDAQQISQTFCQGGISDGFPGAHMGFERAVDNIRRQLQHAWSVCSTKFPDMTRDDLALQGIDVLIKKQAPKKKLQTKGKPRGKSAKGARKGG